MEHSCTELVRRLYEAMARGDEEEIHSCLAGGVVWHEPDLGSKHTGDLAGQEAVMAVISRAQGLTGVTSRLHPRHIAANGKRAVALVGPRYRAISGWRARRWPSTACVGVRSSGHLSARTTRRRTGSSGRRAPS